LVPEVEDDPSLEHEDANGEDLAHHESRVDSGFVGLPERHLERYGCLLDLFPVAFRHAEHLGCERDNRNSEDE